MAGSRTAGQTTGRGKRTGKLVPDGGNFHGFPTFRSEIDELNCDEAKQEAVENGYFETTGVPELPDTQFSGISGDFMPELNEDFTSTGHQSQGILYDLAHAQISTFKTLATRHIFRDHAGDPLEAAQCTSALREVIIKTLSGFKRDAAILALITALGTYDME